MNVSCPQCSTVYRVDPAKVPQGGVRARCSTCSGVIPVGMAGPQGRVTPPDSAGAVHSRRATPPSPFVPGQARPATPAQPSVSKHATPAATPQVPTPGRQSPRVTTPVSSAPRAETPRSPMPPLGAALPPVRSTPRAPWPAVSKPAEPYTAPVSVPPVTPPPQPTPPFVPPPVTSAPQAGATPASGASGGASAAQVPGPRSPINPFLSRDPSLRAKRLARALVSDMVAYYPAKHAEGLEKGTLKELFREEIKKSYDEYVAQVGADFARSTLHFQESLNEVLGAGKKIF